MEESWPRYSYRERPVVDGQKPARMDFQCGMIMDLTSGFYPGEVRLDAYNSLHVRDGGLQWAKGWSGTMGYKDVAGTDKSALFVSGILIDPDL